VSEAVAAKVVATRRAQVHDRYLKYWAKKVCSHLFLFSVLVLVHRISFNRCC
jgi:hypothetical protein